MSDNPGNSPTPSHLVDGEQPIAPRQIQELRHQIVGINKAQRMGEFLAYWEMQTAGGFYRH